MKEIFILALGPFILVGAFLLFYGISERRRSQMATQWHTVEGKALSADIQESRGKRSNVWYVPRIEYEYWIGGARYTSHRIAFGSTAFRSESEAESFLRDHFAGKSIQVYYSPKNPKDAVLLTGESPHTLGFIIAGVVLIAFVLALGFYFLIPR